MFDLYASRVERLFGESPVVVSYSLNAVSASPSTGYVEGEAVFVNGSRLVFFEFLRRSGTRLDREKYRYHFMDSRNRLIFRYDNAPHHPQVSTFPHHKHLPGGVVESPAPDIAGVLGEIEEYVLGISRS